MECIGMIRKTQDLFADDISKYIYKNRIFYNIFEENEYIKNIIMTNRLSSQFLSNMLKIKEPVAVWGAGIRAVKFRKLYTEIKITCYIDEVKNGDTLDNIKVISFEDFVQNYPYTKIIILPRFFHREIKNKILNAGIEADRILDFADIMEQLYEDQYFDLPELRINTTGIFIDGGAFDGNDSLKFKKYGGGVKYKYGNPITK